MVKMSSQFPFWQRLTLKVTTGGRVNMSNIDSEDGPKSDKLRWKLMFGGAFTVRIMSLSGVMHFARRDF